MRIRKTFAVAFALLILAAGYLGFAPLSLANDKFLHFLVFFLLTITFYWVFDTTRRRLINATIIVCVLIGGVGSELVQSFLPYREFDIYDIVANVIGSLLALAISSWYHRGNVTLGLIMKANGPGMLERRRAAKYFAVPANGTDLEQGPEAGESVALSDLGNSEETPVGVPRA